MTISEGVLEEKWCDREGHMLKADLSTSSTAVERLSSGQVGPRRAAFWVVAYTGMERMEAARRSFWDVRILGGRGQRGEGEGAGRGDVHFVVFPDCGAELLLDVADAEVCQIGFKAGTSGDNRVDHW